nr:hypothetical protein [uncultured Dongia sp.]
MDRHETMRFFVAAGSAPTLRSSSCVRNPLSVSRGADWMRLVRLSFVLLLAACVTPATPPAEVAGSYRLDYSGVYGVGRVDLLLQDGQVSGLNPKAGAITYRGLYRTAKDGRNVTLDLIAHLPPVTQAVAGVAVVTTARDIPVRIDLPPDLAPGAHWLVRMETQSGPISAILTRLQTP